MPKRVANDRKTAVVAGVALAAMAARLVYLLRRPFWFDELFTLWIARRPAAILPRLRLDSGPPLFYFVQAPLVALGEALRSDMGARAISLVAIAALFLAERRPESSGGRRFPILLACSPLLFFYSAEARAYAVLSALSFVLFLAVFRMRRGSSPGVYAAAAALLLPWIHYLGVFVVAGSIFLAASRRKWGLAVVQATAALPFLAWIPVALRQPAAATGWSGESFGSSLGGSLGVFGFWPRVPAYFSSFGTPAPIAGTILGLALIGLTIAASRRDRAVREALLFAAIPLALAAGAGFVRPIWFAGRTEMSVLPVMLWAFARAARRLRGMAVLTTVAAAGGTVLIGAALASPPAVPPYSVTSAFVAARAARGDAVVASDADYLPLRLAADRGVLAAPLLGIPSEIERHPGWFEAGRLLDPSGEGARLEGFLAGRTPGGRVFFAVPPDPAARSLVNAYLAGRSVSVARPRGGDAVAVAGP